MNDTEALKALVAKWRTTAKFMEPPCGPAFNECADALEVALERMLASQGEQREAEVPPLTVGKDAYCEAICMAGARFVVDKLTAPDGFTRLVSVDAAGAERLAKLLSHDIERGLRYLLQEQQENGDPSIETLAKNPEQAVLRRIAPPLGSPGADVEDAAIDILHGLNVDDNDGNIRYIAGIILRHLHQQAVPDGWVLVPREPTEAMMLAGAKADADQQYLKNNAWERCVGEEYRQEWLNGAKHSYRAMLAAAPIAPEGKKP